MNSSICIITKRSTVLRLAFIMQLIIRQAVSLFTPICKANSRELIVFLVLDINDIAWNHLLMLIRVL